VALPRSANQAYRARSGAAEMIDEIAEAPALTPNEFRCAQCGEVFEKGVTDEEASAERDENGWSGVECDLVCDDCYNAVLKWAAGLDR